MSSVAVIQPAQTTWKPHPELAGVEIAHLLSLRQDRGVAAIALVRLTAGARPEKHVHEGTDDILYVLQGRAAMWVEGVGDVPLVAGTFLRIPRGTWHQPHDIEEELLAYDAWCPSLT
jgi:mannose-6-phosphate isomerase-like protein (cupin superfamily)